MIGGFFGEDNALGRFTRDLTQEARAGQLEPVRSRDEEIARVIDILLRHGKNNPALVGPAGVGKTAIVEGLAQRVAAGGVPLVLRGGRVLALDHVLLLGATTDEEYERWVLGDPALERRFQKIAVRELGAEETLDILRARKERLERHHNVLISEEALLAAVQLTDAFVTDRRRPDKAIDALDEACAHAQALAPYSSRAEALIAQRRAMLKKSVEGRGSRGERP